MQFVFDSLRRRRKGGERGERGEGKGERGKGVEEEILGWSWVWGFIARS